MSQLNVSAVHVKGVRTKNSRQHPPDRTPPPQIRVTVKLRGLLVSPGEVLYGGFVRDSQYTKRPCNTRSEFVTGSLSLAGLVTLSRNNSTK